MKRFILVNSLLVLFTTFAGCKEKQALKDNIWEVVSMKVHADSVLQYPPNFTFLHPARKTPIILSFPRTGEYELRLEANGCSGKVKFGINNSVKFKGALCTYMGGDSQFAKDCIRILWESINSYTMDNNKLILKGNNGEIINFVKQ